MGSRQCASVSTHPARHPPNDHRRQITASLNTFTFLITPPEFNLSARKERRRRAPLCLRIPRWRGPTIGSWWLGIVGAGIMTFKCLCRPLSKEGATSDPVTSHCVRDVTRVTDSSLKRWIRNLSVQKLIWVCMPCLARCCCYWFFWFFFFRKDENVSVPIQNKTAFLLRGNTIKRLGFANNFIDT